MKKYILILLCIALALAACGCAAKTVEPAPAKESAPAGESAAAEAPSEAEAAPQSPAEPEPEPEAQPEEGPVIGPLQEDETDTIPDVFNEPVAGIDEFVSGGMHLSVPTEYSDLVQVSMGSALFGADNLFSVREIASTEAGEKAHPGEDWGEGALFGIGRMSEDEAHDLMCGYMNNETIFARDAEKNYYVLFRPSDVRFYRENMEENMEALVNSPDMQQWGALNEWAESVPAQFIRDNGLEAWHYRGSSTEMMLSRIAYRTDTYFELKSLDYGEQFPESPEPSAAFAAQLLENVSFEYCGDDVEAPDGEYYVIDFPNDMMSVDVFKGGDYIREEYDGFQMLLKVTGPTEGYFAEVMDQWNQALQKAGG